MKRGFTLDGATVARPWPYASLPSGSGIFGVARVGPATDLSPNGLETRGVNGPHAGAGCANFDWASTNHNSWPVLRTQSLAAVSPRLARPMFVAVTVTMSPADGCWVRTSHAIARAVVVRRLRMDGIDRSFFIMGDGGTLF